MTGFEYLRDFASLANRWPNERPSFDEVAFACAFMWAARSTCDRLAAGCVAMNRYDQIVCAGYNGAPPGMPHCSGPGGEGHQMVEGHCVRTLHSEHNLLIQAGLTGIQTPGLRIYLTARPCQGCMKMLVQARTRELHYWKPYNTDQIHDQVEELADKAGIPIIGPYVDEHGDRLL